MKVILSTGTPFSFTHGGLQIQVEQTKAALEKLGIEVEPLRWWDDKQTGDVLHHFNRMPINVLRAAQRAGMKVVMADLLTGQGSRSDARIKTEKLLRRMINPVIPHALVAHFDWESYRLADACVALTPREAQLMKDFFQAPAERVHVVPNGVEDVFFQAPATPRGTWLVCAATITERKRILELAEAAVQAQTPVRVVGKPYSEQDPYFIQFRQLSERNPAVIRFEGPINDRAELARVYREARGFVLLSTIESLSLSALEAAACECPLLLSDLPWATSYFRGEASYCPITSSAARTAACLREFYDAAPNLRPPPKPASWLDVGRKLKAIYEGLLGTGTEGPSSTRP